MKSTFKLTSFCQTKKRKKQLRRKNCMPRNLLVRKIVLHGQVQVHISLCLFTTSHYYCSPYICRAKTALKTLLKKVYHRSFDRRVRPELHIATLPILMAGDDDARHPWFLSGKEDQSATNLNTRIMIIAIISLSSVILLVLALHIYARCILARRINRRRAAAIRRLALSQYSHSQPGHAQSTIVPKPGLSPAVIAALPTFKFQNLVKQGSSDDVTTKSNDYNQKMECSVCLSLLEDEEQVRQLPNCKHTFHVECIDKWFEGYTSCPLCRAEAEPKAVDQPSAPSVDINTNSNQLQDHEYGAQLTETGAKCGGTSSVGSTSRLSSFRRMLSKDRSSRRSQPSAPEVELYVGTTDIERQ